MLWTYYNFIQRLHQETLRYVGHTDLLSKKEKAYSKHHTILIQTHHLGQHGVQNDYNKVMISILLHWNYGGETSWQNQSRKIMHRDLTGNVWHTCISTKIVVIRGWSFEEIENKNFSSTVLGINMLMMLCGPVGGRIRHEADSNPDSN